MTIDEHIASVQDTVWHWETVLRQSRKTALDRLKDEITDKEAVEIDGDLYQIGACIKQSKIDNAIRCSIEKYEYYLARRYKVNGKLADHNSLVKMHYEDRDVDPDEGYYEEWELEEEFYEGEKKNDHNEN